MRQHHGEHPRFGAMDVCPLVPIAGITMEETVAYAHETRRAARRRAGHLDLLLRVRREERGASQPRDRARRRIRGTAPTARGPAGSRTSARRRSTRGYGVTAVSARDFLVAYNVNLNTTSTRRANAIAFDVREKGRQKREGNPHRPGRRTPRQPSLGARHAQVRQGHRLVHRGVRRRPDLDESHEHQRHAGARRLRRLRRTRRARAASAARVPSSSA
jgi:hypothetical protein